jgi:hypothetical protein
MRFYSDLEVDLLIEELTEAALQAIEQAASEAARAAILASLERETAALREAQRLRVEAEWLTQNLRQARKNTVLGVVIGILGGLLVGSTATLIIGRR